MRAGKRIIGVVLSIIGLLILGFAIMMFLSLGPSVNILSLGLVGVVALFGLAFLGVGASFLR